MTDNFGACPRCRATGKVVRNGEVFNCLACDGTGKSGDAMNEGYFPSMLQDKPAAKDVALRPTSAAKNEIFIPSDMDWTFMVNWGASAVKTGMLPSAIKSGEAAALIVLKGRELGLPFMTAMAHIHIINGKPTMSAELIQGLARRNLPGLVINILESDSKVAKIEFIRPERGSKPFIQSFTWDDAVNAKLTVKDVWKQYPSAMLWSRCVTAGLRKVCPEALMGVSYTPEELGANVDGEGNIIETTGRRVTQDKPVSVAMEAAVASVHASMTKWKLNAVEMDKLKEQCSFLGWDGKRLMEETKAKYGKNSLTLLTESEYLQLFQSVSAQVHQLNTALANAVPMDPEWEKEADQAPDPRDVMK